ncbi:DegQ family serine endoprotease [Caenispirillum bisanense]|uniref:DegQ family serine endoprotease n=1 Tax=Caenispirillum bisanense TaxID=414052 RepID=UPI0031D71C55
MPMPEPRRAGRAFLRAAAAAGAGMIVWMQAAAAAPMPESLSGLVEQVSPAVVTITAEKAPPAAGRGTEVVPGLPFPPGSPFEEFFRRFGLPDGLPGAPRGQGRPAVGLGSGFVIDGDGHVVTNNHVIEGAENVSIALTDGTTLKARVIGADDKTDLALLKVDSDRPLPFVQFGDSDTLKVGDWVMAVGNPFGLGGTVTAGIVSARGRALGNGPLDDFIQTDAAINKGNSGGPMFDMDGKVMGVNTAIYSPNGGSVGIGFAVPSNVAKPVIAQLKASGHVTRGWLGVNIQPVTAEIAEALRLPAAKGALVADVTADSPAGAAKLRSGDVITAVDGTAVDQLRDLPRLIANGAPGQTVKLSVLRDGARRTVPVTLGTMPGSERVAAAPAEATPGQEALGLALAPLDEAVRRQLGLEAGERGVVVTAVDPRSAAADRGLRRGDLITRVGATDVAAPREVTAAIAAARKEDRKAVLFMVRREGQTLFVPVPLPTA